MKLPQEVQIILGVFRCFGQEIYLAGGAVRDHVLGKEIRDYDIFLDSAKGDLDELRILADRMGMVIQPFSFNGPYSGARLTKGNLTIEVIGYMGIAWEERLAHFPVNASKVYLNEEGIIVESEQFNIYRETQDLVFDWSHATCSQEKQDAYELKIRRKFS